VEYYKFAGKNKGGIILVLINNNVYLRSISREVNNFMKESIKVSLDVAKQNLLQAYLIRRDGACAIPMSESIDDARQALRAYLEKYPDTQMEERENETLKWLAKKL
jgi:hypothetical protein